MLQQVYLRALVGNGKMKSAAVKDQQDQNLLWNEFYAMMKKPNSTLTLDKLKEAVKNKQETTLTGTNNKGSYTQNCENSCNNSYNLNNSSSTRSTTIAYKTTSNFTSCIIFITKSNEKNQNIIYWVVKISIAIVNTK